MFLNSAVFFGRSAVFLSALSVSSGLLLFFSNSQVSFAGFAPCFQFPNRFRVSRSFFSNSLVSFAWFLSFVLKFSCLFRAACSVFLSFSSDLLRVLKLSSLFRVVRSLFSNSLFSLDCFGPCSQSLVSFERFVHCSQLV